MFSQMASQPNEIPKLGIKYVIIYSISPPAYGQLSSNWLLYMIIKKDCW